MEEKKCNFCGEHEGLEEVKVYLNEEYVDTYMLCPKCKSLFKNSLESSTFGRDFLNFIKELQLNWERGTKENAKVGKIVKIIRLKDETDESYIGRSGVIESIDCIGQLHGTWGGLAIIPELDNFLVFKD